ncbi:EDD domain protein, DegV family, partial [Lactobacillus amylolyticus DSM 11664]
ISSGLSSFYSSLVNIAKEEKRIKIHLFDPKITCAGEADAALLAGKLVQAGASPDLIMHDLEDLRKTMDIRFMVDDLNHLKRTGRLSNATSFMGTLLHIKPILSMDVQGEGKISAIAKERQYKRAYKHVQNDFAKLTSECHIQFSALSLIRLIQCGKKNGLLTTVKNFQKLNLIQQLLVQ